MDKIQPNYADDLQTFEARGNRNSVQPFIEKLATREQLAESLGLSRSYVSKLMAEEGLPYMKIGRAVRFRTSEVLAWLQSRSKP